jgi:hypothetical protein
VEAVEVRLVGRISELDLGVYLDACEMFVLPDACLSPDKSVGDWFASS